MEELEYKGDKIVKYGENDYVGFYFNADGDIDEIHCKTYKETCSQLDEYNAFVNEIKKELGE